MNTRRLNMLGWLVALALFALNVPGMADDVLKLKSGASMTGKLLNPSEKNPEIYKFETTDGIRTWRTTGASYDIIDASWQALADSYEYAFQTARKETV